MSVLSVSETLGSAVTLRDRTALLDVHRVVPGTRKDTLMRQWLDSVGAAQEATYAAQQSAAARTGALNMTMANDFGTWTRTQGY